ncbi:autotransporter outer membrane beta-barrel domain-containing protein [Candidatus Pelagibacter ubique]|nr:autotransporter outer membrane beta-barrel domain-containing protein [Candidatus Pelagibacter ubique]
MRNLFKKIIVIIKINILVLASYTSSAQATTTFVDAFSLIGQENDVTGFSFNDDGSKMFVVGITGDDVNEYTLGTAYDVSTAVFVDSVDISAFSVNPSAITFNDLGDKMYIVDDIGNQINEFDLTTPFDVSTLIIPFIPVVLDLAPDLILEPTGIAFNNDGTKMFITDRARGLINEYVLLGGYDMGTAVHISTFDFTAEDAGPEGIAFNNNGTKMFFIGVNTIVYEYALTTAFDVTTASFTDSFDVSSQDTETTSVEFNGDGTKMFILGNDSSNINEYTLSVAFDIVTSADEEEAAEEEAAEEEAGLANPVTDKDVIGSINAQSNISKNIISQSIGSVSSRLSNLRRNRDSNNLSQNNIKLDFNNAILTSLTEELLAKNDKSIIPDNWSSWSEGTISVSKIGDRINSSSSKTDGQNLALGFDTKLNNNDLLGFAVQYGQSDTDIGSNGTNVDSENINLSIYRTRPLDDDNFIEGMFGVGLIESDLKRVSGANTLTGSRNGTQIFGSINYGKTLDKGDFNLTPIARVDLGYTELDAYSETGTDALTYAKQTIESGLASVGLEFSDIVKFNDNKFKPFGSIEYGMDFSNSSDAKMNYVSDTSTIYTYTQGSNSNHLITSVVGFEYITKDNLEIISSYKRIQGNESEQTDILNVSVNFKSKRETEYAMSLDGSEDLKAGFDISKNINGFDLNFNANQSLSENSNRVAEVSMSRKF